MRRGNALTLAFLLVTLAVLLMAASSPVVDSDNWRTCAPGRGCWSSRKVLRQDPSTTRLGEPWVYPGWLAQISPAAAHQMGGLAAVHLWTGAILTLTFILVWMTMDGPLLMRAFVLLLAAATSSVFWSARPHIFSLVLTAGMVLLLERFVTKPTRWIWLSVGLMALWPNLHGAFPTGLLLIGLYLLAVLLTWRWRSGRAPAARRKRGGGSGNRCSPSLPACCSVCLRLGLTRTASP